MIAARRHLSLPRRTSATSKGPTVSFEGTSLALRYDFECDDGQVEWTQLRFGDVLAFEFRQAAACRAEDVVSFEDVTVLEGTPWLSDLVTTWQASVGWQDWQQQRGGASRFKHFRVYFDDVGVLDVAAERVEIE